MAVTDRRRLTPTAAQVATGLVVAGIVSLCTLGTAFGLFAVGIEAFWVAFPVGYGGLLPIALGLVAWVTAPAD